MRDSPTPQGDELIYHLMARDPFDPHTFPFAYRFGVPLLVHVLPFSQEHSFSWLARDRGPPAGGPRSRSSSSA